MRCHHFKQLHRKDKYTIIISCIFGGIALIFLCVGLALPTWYVGFDSRIHSIVVTANYFFTCHLSVDETSTELLCISYSSYICNDTVPIGCQNATTLGCTNPASSAKLYQYLDAPITYISLEDLQRVRVSGATAIVGIIILTISIGLMLAFSCCQLPLGFLYVSPILLYISDLFLVVSLVTGSLVIRYYHVGCGLFVTGTMITFIFTIVGAFTVGRLEARRNNIHPQLRAQIYETTEINDNIK
jgi:hypothetical protein